MSEFENQTNQLFSKSVETKAVNPFRRGMDIGDLPVIYGNNWGLSRLPTKEELIRNYRGIPKACADLNANTIANIPLRLYVEAGNEQTRWKTAPVSNPLRKKTLLGQIRKKTYWGDVDEVVSHPLLDLLDKPNPDCDALMFLSKISLFKDICGTAYILIARNNLGVPSALYCLPSQFVQVQYENLNSYSYPTGYTFCGKPLNRADLIIINGHTLDGSEGLSPLASAWDFVLIANKLVKREQNLLDTGRPDYIFGFKGEYAPLEDEIAITERKINAAMRARNGGIWGVPADIEVHPLSFSPKDMSVFEIQGRAKIEICNAFDVPIQLLEGKEVNSRASHETAQLQHNEKGIEPRLRFIESALNSQLLPLFDDSGRFYLAFDETSIPDRAIQVQELTQYKNTGILATNECRQQLGYAPLEGEEFDVPVHMNAGAQTTVNVGGMNAAAEPSKPTEQPEQTEQEQEPTVIPEPTEQPTTDLEAIAATGDTAGAGMNGAQLASILDICGRVVAGELPAPSAFAIIAAGFPLLKPEQIDAILKPLATVKPPEPEPQEPAPAPQDEGDEEQEQPKKSLKAARRKRETIPEPDPKLVKVFKDFFAKQEEHYLGKVKSMSGLVTKALPDKFVPIEDWTEELANEVKPLIELTYDKRGKQVVGDIGASPDVFSVRHPKIQKAIDDRVYTLCEETIATTTKELNDALDSLRAEITEGLAEGASPNMLMDRIKSVFENAEDFRAMRIARNETNSAFNNATLLASRESGLVKGFNISLSDQACEECIAFEAANPFIPIEQEGVLPIHIQCSCSYLYVFNDDEVNS